MDVKRNYHPRREGETPRVSHVEVNHTGVSAEQNLSTRLVNEWLASGAITIADGKLVIKAKPEDLVYEIIRGPGRYCCHCGILITDGERGEASREHIAKAHPDLPSPDPNWPLGYAVLNHWELRLTSQQHEKFRFGSPKAERGPAKSHIRLAAVKRATVEKPADGSEVVLEACAYTGASVTATKGED